jgi:phytoene dehydrogenase-like protein
MDSRVVVIGAGHHGLVAAITLAERGREVVVLEAADRPGGAVCSAELTLPGFVHDTCSGFFPLIAASPAFRELGLQLEWVNPPVAMAHVLDEHGSEISPPRRPRLTPASRAPARRGAAWCRRSGRTAMP